MFCILHVILYVYALRPSLDDVHKETFGGVFIAFFPTDSRIEHCKRTSDFDVILMRWKYILSCASVDVRAHIRLRIPLSS